jgi:hypothetical protein
MKLIIMNKTGEITDQYEGLNGCNANLQGVKWNGGSIEGIKHNFVLLDENIEVDEKSLPLYTQNFYRNLIIEEMKKECNKEILNGFTSSNGQEYDFGYNDQQKLTQKLTLLMIDPQIQEITWKTKEGSMNTFTRDEFMSFVKEAEDFKDQMKSKYRQRKEELQQISDIEAIKKFTFKDGVSIESSEKGG